MLYLEDFLELIDQLPLEMRDRFTELRTLDLRTQNGLDTVQDQAKNLFRMAPTMSKEVLHGKYEEIKKGYKEILEHSDEKVMLANTMYDLVERYQRKLDGEVAKFKLELEADSPGITQVLEQKVRESEQQLRHQRREQKRKRKVDPGVFDQFNESERAVKEARKGGGEGPSGTARPTLSLHHQFNTQRRAQNYPNRLSEIRALNASPSQHMPGTSASGPMASPTVGRPLPTGPIRAGEFMHTFAERESRHGRPRKLTSRVQEMLKETMDRRKELREEIGKSSSTPDSEDVEEEGGGVGDEGEEEEEEEEEGEGQDDVDQRKWCICNQTSYGEMVACDNPRCPFEWFHYPCVKITQPPKGKWFCPHCTDALRRRSSLTLSTTGPPL